MSVAFISSDFSVSSNNILVPGGCGYYRCVLPMLVCGQRSHAGRMAWDPIRGFGVRDTETTGVFGFNTVMLKLVMDRGTPKQIEIAQSLGQRIVVDVDDYYQGLTPSNAAYEMTNPETNKRRNRDIYNEVIEAADIVTVSTPFLLDHYKAKRENVYLVRNGVNARQFHRRPLSSSKPVIGWTGSTSYRNNDLEQLREWLPDFLEEHDLMFHHAGHSDNGPTFHHVTGVNPNRIRTSPILPITHYPDAFQFDIGIVPLADIPFNHAKSNIKGLEYAANGIPFVASDLPEYRLLHEDGVGHIAKTANDWRAQMTYFLDYNNRKKESARIRDVTSQNWSIEARAKEWINVFAA